MTIASFGAAHTVCVPRTCPFCDRPADTAEHVEPRWISRHYLECDASPGTFTMSFGDLYPSRTVPLLNQTVRVCGVCNGGRMAALERRVKPALLRMKEGEGLIIGPDGQRALTHWLLKNAVVRELVMPRDSPFRVSTPRHRRQVATGVLPNGWRVAIAGYEGPGPNLAHSFSRVKQHVDDTGRPLGRIVLHTLRFECFVAQVLVHSLRDPPELANLLGGPQYAVEIPRPAAVVWPPSAVLGPEWMETIQHFGPDRPRPPADRT